LTRRFNPEGADMLLAIGVIILALATFAAMAAFVALCDRV
jgi:hypothetical protein